MASDIVYKRDDTFPPLKATLEQVNQTTNITETIDLATCLKVQAILKPPSGAAILIACTAWGGGGIKTATGATAGKVEVPLAQTTFATVGEWKVEWEIEWPETGGVKRFQTVPNSGYRTIEVVTDLGGA